MATVTRTALTGWHGNSSWTQYSNIQVGPGWQSSDRYGRLQFSSSATGKITGLSFRFYHDSAGSGGTFTLYATDNANILGANMPSGATLIGTGSFGMGREWKTISISNPQNLPNYTGTWYLIIKSSVTTTISATTAAKVAELTIDYETTSKCTPPTSITGPTLAVAPNTNHTISWSGMGAGNSNPIAGYQLYRSTSSTSGFTTLGSTLTSPSASVTSHSGNGSAYYYKVVTIGTAAGYNSDLSSATFTLTTSWSDVPTPVNFTSNAPTHAVPGGSYRLTWAMNASAVNNPTTGYIVYRDTSPSGSFPAITGKITDQFLNITAPTANNTSYYYKVRAIGTVGGSDSAQTSAIAVSTRWDPVALPTNLALSKTIVASGNVKLTWTRADNQINNDVSYYMIYRNGSHYSTPAASATSAEVPSNSAGSSYTYTMYTVGARNTVGPTSGVTVHTYSNLGTPSLSISATEIDSGGSVTLTGTAGAEGYQNKYAGYRLEEKVGAGDWTPVLDPSSGSGFTTTRTLSAGMGTTIQYKMYVKGTQANSAYSNIVSVKIRTYTAHTMPNTLNIDASVLLPSKTTTIRWNAAAKGENVAITGYGIYKNGTHIATAAAAATTYTVTASSVNDAKDVYRVRALASNSIYHSNYTAEVTLSTYGLPTAPTLRWSAPNTTDLVLFLGPNGRPTTTLSWSGATGGAGGAISGYTVFKSDGTAIATVANNVFSYSVNETTGYYVRVNATAGTKDSNNCSISTTGTPANTSITSNPPAGSTYGSSAFSWGAVSTPANTTLSYLIAYQEEGKALTYLTSVGPTPTSHSWTPRTVIAEGKSFTMGVKVRATGKHGGYADSPNYIMTTTVPFIPVRPGRPTATATDKNGNTTYTQNAIKLTLGYAPPARAAAFKDYIIRRKTRAADTYGDWAVTSQNTYEDTSVADSGAGSVYYYQVVARDVHGRTSEVAIETPVITKIGLPSLSFRSPDPVVVSGVPNTGGTVYFTPTGGGYSRPLSYQLYISYGSQSSVISTGTIAASALSTLHSLSLGNLSISYLNSTRGLSALYKRIITDRYPKSDIRIGITLTDAQTIPVKDNTKTFEVVYKSNYTTTPSITAGAPVLTNQTATANGKTIDYLNSNDQLKIDFSSIAVASLDAAGGTAGRGIEYVITGPFANQTDVKSSLPAPYIVTNIPTFTGDGSYTVTVQARHTYAQSADNTTSNTVPKSIETKRFVKPDIRLFGAERTAEEKFKISITLTNAQSGGSDKAPYNVASITGLTLRVGSTNVAVPSVTINQNKMYIGGVSPGKLVDQSAGKADQTVYATATLTTTSGVQYTLTSPSFILKAFGVALALRKTRVGVNVAPTTFLESTEAQDDTGEFPSLVIYERQTRKVGPVMELANAVGNVHGTGIRFRDTLTDTGLTTGLFRFKYNQFYFDKVINATTASFDTPLAIGSGGTASSSASGAITNLGAASITPNHANAYLGATYVSQGLEKPTYFKSGSLRLQMLRNTNVGTPGTWMDALWLSSYTGGDVKGSNLLVFGKNTDYIGFMRQDYDAANWGTTREILHSGNYDSYALPLSGGTMTGSVSFPDGAGIHNSSAYILLGYNSSVGTGTTLASSQAITRIRSSTTTNLVHRVGSTEYPILTSSNYSSYVTPAGIGAAASSHSHSYLPLSGGALTGNVTQSSSASIQAGSFARLTSWANQLDGKAYNWHIYLDGTNAVLGYTNGEGARTNYTLTHSHPYAASSHTHSYAPLTGAGTSGTWGISITGNATTATTASDSSKLNGVASAEASTVSTIVKRNSSGDINTRLFRSEYANQTTISGAIAFRINNSTDNYVRFCSDAAAIRTFIGCAASSHGNHVPTTQTANNAVYLRNDNTWQTITPAKIGAAAASHTHSYLPLSGGTLTGNLIPNSPAIGTAAARKITISSSNPSGGSAGDVWIQY